MSLRNGEKNSQKLIHKDHSKVIENAINVS
jgi:hypothetical protein